MSAFATAPEIGWASMLADLRKIPGDNGHTKQVWIASKTEDADLARILSQNPDDYGLLVDLTDAMFLKSDANTETE